MRRITTPLWWSPLPEGARLSLKPFDRAEPGADIVHAFFRTRTELDARAAPLITLPAAGGMIWISWPKKSSPLFRDLTENGLREVLLPTGWVDVKVAAVDADWSGLKFLRRRA